MSDLSNTLTGLTGLKIIESTSSTLIPYKTSNTPFQQHGYYETIIILIFCLLSWGVYFFFRKKNINKIPFLKEKKIKIIERTKITTRSSILLIQYENRYFLMNQSNDNLTLIAEVSAEQKQI